MKPPARSRRRLDLARMKAKCRRIRPWDKDAQAAEHLKVCSCMMCGNPRRRWGSITLQEIRADDAARAD